MAKKNLTTKKRLPAKKTSKLVAQEALAEPSTEPLAKEVIRQPEEAQPEGGEEEEEDKETGEEIVNRINELLERNKQSRDEIYARLRLLEKKNIQFSSQVR